MTFDSKAKDAARVIWKRLCRGSLTYVIPGLCQDLLEVGILHKRQLEMAWAEHITAINSMIVPWFFYISWVNY